ncbi:hypothetical protein NQ315_017038 [Exocentrus adspersus]|uniref:Protein hunchback n=1 Tax=Exocentrus adspersus TaxID=1586481 RepID=A0AAV8V5B7_9CUCU|nr:hypothetical protein NQ315_017038 [Exocentrus adspersus]
MEIDATNRLDGTEDFNTSNNSFLNRVEVKEEHGSFSDSVTKTEESELISDINRDELICYAVKPEPDELFDDCSIKIEEAEALQYDRIKLEELGICLKADSTESFSSETTGRSLEADTKLDPLPKNSLASSSNIASTSTLIEGVGPLGCESSSQIYQCDFCDYKSRLKYCITSHIRSIHKKPSEIKWFECDLCDYKAKQKGDLNKHTAIHKDSCQFECNFCEFKSKYKRCLDEHMVIHKDLSKIEWFECHLCDYKAKRKRNLRAHTLIHKKPLGN